MTVIHESNAVYVFRHPDRTWWVVEAGEADFCPHCGYRAIDHRWPHLVCFYCGRVAQQISDNVWSWDDPS